MKDVRLRGVGGSELLPGKAVKAAWKAFNNVNHARVGRSEEKVMLSRLLSALAAYQAMMRALATEDETPTLN